MIKRCMDELEILLSGENPDPERLLCNRDLSKIKFTDFKKKKKKKKKEIRNCEKKKKKKKSVL